MCDAFTKVSGIEFCDCGVEIVAVEDDNCLDAVVSPYFDYAEGGGVKSAISRPAAEGEMDATQYKSFPACCHRKRRDALQSEICDHAQVLQVQFSSAAHPGSDYFPAVIHANVVRQSRAQTVPVTGGEVRIKALCDLSRRILQPGRRPTQLVEPGERDVQICLVE